MVAFFFFFFNLHYVVSIHGNVFLFLEYAYEQFYEQKKNYNLFLIYEQM